MPLWQIDIYPADGQVDREAQSHRRRDRMNLGLGDDISVVFARRLSGPRRLRSRRRDAVGRIAVVDSVTERSVVAIAGQDVLNEPPGEQTTAWSTCCPSPA